MSELAHRSLARPGRAAAHASPAAPRVCIRWLAAFEDELEVTRPTLLWVLPVSLAALLLGVAASMDHPAMGAFVGMLVGAMLFRAMVRFGGSQSVALSRDLSEGAMSTRSVDLKWVVQEQKYCQLCEDVQRDLEATVRESLGEISLGFTLRDNVVYAQQARLWSGEDKAAWARALRLRQRILTEPDAPPSTRAMTAAMESLQELKSKLRDGRVQMRDARNDLEHADKIQTSKAADRLRG
jgi:hypothetical protein